jgi:GTP cyclohydrolase II
MLGVTKVRLITNNPDKVEALRSAGIETERVTAWTVERPENSAYLAAKRAKMGHIL